jgi:chromosome segregation ATPase
MKIVSTTAVLACALAFLSAIGPAQADDDERAALQKLLKGNEILTAQLDKAKKADGQIAKAQLAIDGAQKALSHAVEQVRHEGETLIDQQKNIDQEANRTGCPWGGESPDKAFVASCNQEAAKLNSLLSQVRQNAISLKDYANALDKEQSRLSGATVSLFQKKKINDANINELAALQAQWARRFNRIVFQSEAYERLKVMAPAAQICEQISESGAEGDLERAHHCLQQLWDGAK